MSQLNQYREPDRGVSSRGGLQSQDDLSVYFNKSVAAVQFHADHFERDVVRPAFANSHMFFKERPITATLVAIFSLLSFLPFLGFVSASLFTVATVILIAVCATVLACGTGVLTYLSLLLFALFINFLLALFFTGLATFAYLFLRLAIMVRERGTAGISDWLLQLQNFALGANTPHVADDGSSSSSDGVFVQAAPAVQSIDSQDEKPLNELEIRSLVYRRISNPVAGLDMLLTAMSGLHVYSVRPVHRTLPVQPALLRTDVSIGRSVL